MKEKNINQIMYLMIAIGLVLVIAGISLIIFTDIYISKGATGVLIIAAVIGLGLFLLLPAKIYLTLQLMKNNDKKLRANTEK